MRTDPSAKPPRDQPLSAPPPVQHRRAVAAHAMARDNHISEAKHVITPTGAVEDGRSFPDHSARAMPQTGGKLPVPGLRPTTPRDVPTQRNNINTVNITAITQPVCVHAPSAVGDRGRRRATHHRHPAAAPQRHVQAPPGPPCRTFQRLARENFDYGAEPVPVPLVNPDVAELAQPAADCADYTAPSPDKNSIAQPLDSETPGVVVVKSETPVRRRDLHA